jgi:hypothetical protein
MNILDENVPDEQRTLLERWRIRVKKIGQDVGRQGMKDQNEVIPLLHSLRRPVLFTCDLGLYSPRFTHRGYCIACIATLPDDVARFIRRFLGHSAFDTKAKRMGSVVRVSEVGLRAWRVGEEQEVILKWDKKQG